MTNQQRNATLVWGGLTAVLVVFTVIFVIGLLQTDTTTEGAPPPRCAVESYTFSGRITDPQANPIPHAVITLRADGYMDVCQTMLDADDLTAVGASANPIVPDAHPSWQGTANADGTFAFTITTVNDALLWLEVGQAGYTRYQSPQFSGSYLPYWQYTIIQLPYIRGILG